MTESLGMTSPKSSKEDLITFSRSKQSYKTRCLFIVYFAFHFWIVGLTPVKNIMKNINCSKHATSLLITLAFCLTNIPCCASQRSFLSLGTKIEDKKPTSASSRTRNQKKPFFGAAAAEIVVDDDGETY